MSKDLFSGVKVLETDLEKVDLVYKDKVLPIWDNRLKIYPNQFVYLKSLDNNSNVKGAITIASQDAKSLKLVHNNISASGIRPRNKEQTMAMSALLDTKIPLNIMTGVAGTGKTLISIAAALQHMEDGNYERIIFTRPMSQVGDYELGILPGDVNEKFGPYLENYITNIRQLVGNDKQTTQDLIDQYNIDIMPLQLIRGCSWTKTCIIADEVQVCNFHEMLTLGTRIGEDSKLIVMGDLNQRDKKISKQDTGLFEIINNERMKKSELVSTIELIKVERSKLARLFADVFEG